jgi:hypothetical protein
MALRLLNAREFASGAPAGPCDVPANSPNPANQMRSTEGGAFILPSVGRSPSAPMPPCQTHATMRNRAKHAQSTHCGLRSGNLRTNRPSSCDGAVIGRAGFLRSICIRTA